jgi:hypothetical protein
VRQLGVISKNAFDLHPLAIGKRLTMLGDDRSKALTPFRSPERRPKLGLRRAINEIRNLIANSRHPNSKKRDEREKVAQRVFLWQCAA